MSFYQWLIVGHIAVFGIWFGTDLATFYLSRRVINPEIEVPTRAVMASSMLGIEVVARLCLPTMLALGLSLSIEVGYLDLADGMIALVWALWAAWLALIWTIHRQDAGELAGLLANVDLGVRALVCAGLWVLGTMSAFQFDGPFSGYWVGTKVLLFALIMTTGITIRFMLKPFSAAFGELVAHGSSPEREGAMAAALKRAQPLVGLIWGSLALSLIVAVAQRVPWD